MNRILREYPTEMTDAAREKNRHISMDDMIKDIVATIDEIRRLKLIQAAEKVLGENYLDNNERRIAQFKSDARPYQIEERKKFVAFLKLLLADRGYDVSQFPEE